MTKDTISFLKEQIIEGKDITIQDALKLIHIDFKDNGLLSHLLACANDIREKFMGYQAEMCTIINAKSGKCPEDCKFCAQSAYYCTNVKKYRLIDYEAIRAKALEVQALGVHRFSLVTSGRGPTDEDIEILTDFYKRLRKETHLKLCASLGIITYEQAVKLKESGVLMYHHNIECCKDYYATICSTHTYEDRIQAIKNAKKAGLDVCCGGIIGLGESKEHRVKMAFEIKALDVRSIPINVLTPIKGTPLEKNVILEPNEILKTMAVFRFINPNSMIRYAAGRSALRDKQIKGFKGGINAALVGDFLTTLGSNVEEDKTMMKKAGFSID